MSTHLFCCTNIKPTQPTKLEHEQTFNKFTKWAMTTVSSVAKPTPPPDASCCIQLVRQANSALIESMRYFPATDNHGHFEEVSEHGISGMNFVKVNEYARYQCRHHNQVFDLNLYKRVGETGLHRWRASIAKSLRRVEHVFKHRAHSANSGSGSGSSHQSEVVSRGSGAGTRFYASPAHEYGAGMGYGSGWGSGLGSGWGLNWGTGDDNKSGASSTVAESGANDSDDSDDEEDCETVLSSSEDVEEVDSDGSEDQDVSSLLDADVELKEDSAQGDETDPSPSPETQVAFQDGIVEQSYLDVEDYGYYDSGLSADNYGCYDCDGLDPLLTFDRGYEDWE